MVSEKFGLAELERYVNEVGLSPFRNDVRTIKGILAVVGIPNKIIEEGREVIASCLGAVEISKGNIEDTRTADKEDNQRVKDEKARLNAVRNDTKRANKQAVNDEKSTKKQQQDEVRRLNRLLGKFAS